MLRRLPAVGLAAVFVLLTLMGASAVAAPRPATPQLIEQDVRGKRIPPKRGHLYRAYAIGRPEKLPSAYRSRAPWDGTLVLLELRRTVERMEDGPTKREIQGILQSGAATDCGGAGTTLAGETSSENFYVQHGTIGGGLTIDDYLTSLETSWSTHVVDFGWAAPPVAPTPAPGSRYHVRIEPLAGGLYGYVSSGGTHAGLIGNNPNTGWDDKDSLASCMVLNSDFEPFPGTAQQAMDATIAHEYNHSVQYGYGALSGANTPDDVFVEGGATWMEDEVFDAADDNHNYLWPHFHDGMGEYGGSAYGYWITFRGLTERFGTGAGGAGEDVMQRFWELTSQNAASNLGAMDAALVAEGTTLAEAFHDYSIAAAVTRACGGGYVLPHCFEEAPAYIALAGQPVTHGTIATLGGTFSHTVEDNFAIRWVTLPASGGPFLVSLQNTTAPGGPGRLRATAVCDTGLALRLHPLPVATDGEEVSGSFDAAGCVRTLLSITNETKTADNPGSSTTRGFTVRTAPLPEHTLTVATGGTGSGTVVSAPAGIDCGSACTAAFPQGTVVTLTPTAASGSTFAGWSGACSGTGACEVTMAQAQDVAATFTVVEQTAAPTAPAPASPAPVAPAPVVPADVTAPAFSIPVRSLRADRRGRIRLPIACAAGEPADCRGTARLELGRRAAGRRSFQVAAGRKQSVRLRLTRVARKRLARGRSIRLRATVVVTDAAGNSRTVTRTLRVARAR